MEPRTFRATALIASALRPQRFWRCVQEGGVGARAAIMLVIAVAAALHLAGSAARIAGMLLAPVPAATMSPTHRLAEASLAIVAPASRFSGAELWNVSRNAGETEFRGQEAVLAFIHASLAIAVSPWRTAVTIERHPNANWDSRTIELTPSLGPLLSPAMLGVVALAAGSVLFFAARAKEGRMASAPHWMRMALATPALLQLFCIALAATPLPIAAALPVAVLGEAFVVRAWTRPMLVRAA